MNFENLKLKGIRVVLKHTPGVSFWAAKKRLTHIMGIQLSGNMEHLIGKRKIVLKENTVFFFNQKEDFTARVKELGVSFSVHFTTYEDIETESFAGRVNNPAEISKLLSGLENLYRMNKADSNSASVLFYKLCAAIGSAAENSSQGYFRSDARIIAARDYINSHFKEEGCIDSAAALAGVTRRRFNDLFRSMLGITPHKHINSIKLGIAKNLLLTDGLSLSNVAELSGFSDPHYFCRVFKQETGYTPRAYKKSKDRRGEIN